MMTRLLNHLITKYSSTYTRDDRGGIILSVLTIPAWQHLPARVETYAPRNISRQQQFDFQSRQIVIDHIIYTEFDGFGNGDEVFWEDTEQYFKVEAVVKFPAQGALLQYFVIGAVEIMN